MEIGKNEGWQDWKSGKYHSNSGIRNSHIFPQIHAQVASSASLQFLSTRTTSDLANASKPPNAFTVSYESASYKAPSLPRVTMINHQTTHYDPVFHTEVTRSTNLTANRLKSICHFADQTRPTISHSIGRYRDTIREHPKAFNRRSGQFTRYSELCLRTTKPAFVQQFAFSARSLQH